MPEGHVMTVAFAIGLSIQELKLHLAAELRVPAEVLQISVDGTSVVILRFLTDFYRPPSCEMQFFSSNL